jgi:hypothetical protein
MNVSCCNNCDDHDPGRGTVAFRRVLWVGVTSVLLLFAGKVKAEDKEPTAIVELGAAGEWDFPSGKLGPTAAVEFTPIKNWLEIEAGVSPMLGNGQTEWSTDLLFKKPFTLSDKVEFMIGAGPEWTFSREGEKVAAEIAADFMFWPTPDRKFGWFLEPSYSYSLAAGHEQSLGINTGLLIPIP